MITLSVPAFTALTTALWVAAGVMVLLACVVAWNGRLLMALALSAGASALFNAPILAMLANTVKVNFERKGELMETAIGKAVTASSLVFAMTGVLPFAVIFVVSAGLSFLAYAIASALK